MRATAQQILAKLDEVSQNGNWPAFDAGLGVLEYHAMRMIAVRERGGDEDWGLAFECVLGDFLDPGSDNADAANVSTYLVIPSDLHGIREQRELELSIAGPDAVVAGPADSGTIDIDGITVVGPAGELRCDRSMIARHDLRPGMLCGGCDGGAVSSRAILLIRAYLAHHAGAFWRDVTPLFRAPCDVVVTSDAFEHVLGRRDLGTGDDVEPSVRRIAIAPSESPTFRSLAEALASGDASRFVAGESNLDWRKWATVPDGNAPSGAAST